MEEEGEDGREEGNTVWREHSSPGRMRSCESGRQEIGDVVIVSYKAQGPPWAGCGPGFLLTASPGVGAGGSLCCGLDLVELSWG